MNWFFADKFKKFGETFQSTSSSLICFVDFNDIRKLSGAITPFLIKFDDQFL